MHQNKKHIPVLLEQVIQILDPKEGESYLDLTAGYGGHASAVLEHTHQYKGSTLVDRDQAAVAFLEEQFGSSGIEIVKSDFFAASQRLVQQKRSYDLILADLGVSSPHLNEASRGFAIQHEGPLDMRMDQSQRLTAFTVVNSYSEEELVRILGIYGEEPKARTIARLILRNRPIRTTTQLAQVVAQAWHGHHRVHPATRTFQAIRIAVNDELQQLEQSFPLWIKLLNPGGRLAIISFHSLEDRLVKRALAQESGDRYDAVLQILGHGPIMGDGSELVFNPRARSAKLRAAVKINKERGEANANSGKKQLPHL